MSLWREALRIDPERRDREVVLAPEPYWPRERPLPPGTNPLAERWGFSRGIDVTRLRAAGRGHRAAACLIGGGRVRSRRLPPAAAGTHHTG